MRKKRNKWIQDRYEDASGEMQQISDSTLDAIQNAMGDAGRKSPSDAALVLTEGEEVPVHRPAELTLEDGTSVCVERQLPSDLPIGYHELAFPDEKVAPVRVIVSPRQCHFLPDLRIWGWNVQLYALRSQESWGIGDLADLRRFAAWSANEGAEMVLINPLHAPAPVLPQEASPYSPSTRRYRSPLYLRLDEVPTTVQARAELQRFHPTGLHLNDDRRIHRDEVFRLKMQGPRAPLAPCS